MRSSVSVTLHIYVLVPFLDQLRVLRAVLHSLPFEQLLPLSFSSNAVKNSGEDQTQAKEPSGGYLVAVHYARQTDAEKNACGHNQREHDGTEIFDRVVNQKLSNRTRDGKQEKVQVDFGVILDKLDRGVQLLRVNKRDKRKNSRKGARRKHKFDHAKIRVSLKHSTLKLTCKAVKEEKKKEQHDPSPSCPTQILSEVIVIKVERQIVRRRHEHGNTDSNHESYDVVVLRIGFVTEYFPHEHHRSQFEGLEKCCCWEGYVTERFVLAPAGKHV